MMKIKHLFISSDESRLRSGWRLVIQSLVMFVLLICFTLPFLLTLETLTADMLMSQEFLLISQVAELFGVGISVFLARRLLDKRSFSSLGLKINGRALADILVGFAIPFFMLGAIYLIESSFGWLTFTGFAWQSDSTETVIARMLLSLLTFLMVGWNEELLSRGYQLQNLISGLNIPLAVLISSALFGSLHLSNPNANWESAVGVSLAGIFLAYGYLRTRQLWLPIGLHIGWNFFEGVVFGFPVSGIESYRLIRTTVNGPALWTGGRFGPEAGLVLIPGLLIGVLLVSIYTQNRAGEGGKNSKG
jgi:membrane protease YdiL (CAAX protease family)